MGRPSCDDSRYRRQMAWGTPHDMHPLNRSMSISRVLCLSRAFHVHLAQLPRRLLDAVDHPVARGQRGDARALRVVIRIEDLGFEGAIF